MHVNKKMIFSMLLTGILVGVFFTTRYPDVEVKLAIPLLVRNGYDIDFELPYLFDQFFKLVPFVVMQMFFGIKIYKHFLNMSAYYFLRQSDRVKWFVQEIIYLIIECFLSVSAFYIGFFVYECMLGGNAKLRFSDIRCLIYIILLTFGYNTVFIIACNILAIKTDSTIAFFSVYSFQIISVLINYLMNEKFKISHAIKTIIFKLNFYSNYVLQWHNSNGVEHDYAATEMFNLRLGWSYSFYLFVTMLLIVTGCIITSRQDILGDNEWKN